MWDEWLPAQQKAAEIKPIKEKKEMSHSQINTTVPQKRFTFFGETGLVDGMQGVVWLKLAQGKRDHETRVEIVVIAEDKNFRVEDNTTEKDIKKRRPFSVQIGEHIKGSFRYDVFTLDEIEFVAEHNQYFK
ncbi:hypothetical protein LCGC14_2563220, partial [marine sediment metagenome]